MGCIVSRRPELGPVNSSQFTACGIVGKGGFGLVYAVKRKSRRTSNVVYAMKMMAKVSLMESVWHIDQAWIERDVLRLLYLVQEYLSGGDLAMHLSKRGAFPETLVRFYGAEMVLALEDLHKSSIVHHDVKPANFIIDGNGHARLTDFGLSIILQKNRGFKTRDAGGTPGFMAYESIAGTAHACEPDFFA